MVYLIVFDIKIGRVLFERAKLNSSLCHLDTRRSRRPLWVQSSLQGGGSYPFCSAECAGLQLLMPIRSGEKVTAHTYTHLQQLCCEFQGSGGDGRKILFPEEWVNPISTV